jgi:hypothetical protein
MNGTLANLPAPPATGTARGLDKVSGVSDEAAPGAIGKLICSFVTGAFRQMPVRFQTLAPLLLQVPANARIYRERSGSGYTYCSLKFRTLDRNTGRSCVRGLYLGALGDDVVDWATAILQERAAAGADGRAAPKSPDGAWIKTLRRLFADARAGARRAAKLAGFSFHGYRLVRRKR